MNRLASWIAFAVLSVGITAGCASETSDPTPDQEPVPAVAVDALDPQTSPAHPCLPIKFPICGGGEVLHCTLDAWRCRHCGCSP